MEKNKQIFDAEFKKTLQLLPIKEKDKLILRLLRRNLPLAQRLHFELVDTDSAIDKREQVKFKILERISLATEHYYSPGYLLMDARETSGMINEHVSITKDKQGEISLNCLMIRQILEHNNERISEASQERSYTFCIYVVARIFKILLLIKKQHTDLHIEFSDDIKAIGELIGNNHNLMKIAIHNGLDVNWLVKFDIPENIAIIHKELRSNRFLK